MRRSLVELESCGRKSRGNRVLERTESALQSTALESFISGQKYDLEINVLRHPANQLVRSGQGSSAAKDT